MAKLSFPPQVVTVIPDPRWPWNPAYDLTVEMATKEQVVTDDSVDVTIEFETTGVTRRRLGLRVACRHWLGRARYWWNRLDRWTRR